jgi:hypothetical protein
MILGNLPALNCVRPQKYFSPSANHNRGSNFFHASALLTTGVHSSGPIWTYIRLFKHVYFVQGMHCILHVKNYQHTYNKPRARDICALSLFEIDALTLPLFENPAI